MVAVADGKDGSGDAKKAKLDPEELGKEPQPEPKVEPEPLKDLSCFELKEVLRIDTEHKVAFLHAVHKELNTPAVLILEKKGFEKEGVELFLKENPLTTMTRLTQNDIYGNYDFFPPANINELKCTAIHPATERHIDRFREQEIRVVQETGEDYQNITLPYIQNEVPFSHQWVYNLLEGKSEQDRVIASDDDPETGFNFAIDLKWDGKNVDALYLQAIVKRRDIKSIRDLKPEHLPLLKNVREKCLKAIEDKYGIKQDMIRAYFHYQPTYYHLHIHFVTLKWDAPGFTADRAHILDEVIANITLFPEFYQKAAFTLSLKEKDPLYIKLKEAKNA